MPTSAPITPESADLRARLAALPPEEREQLEAAVVAGYIAALREARDEILAAQGVIHTASHEDAARSAA